MSAIKPLILFSDQTLRSMMGRLLRVYTRPHIKILMLGFICLIVLSMASAAPAVLIEKIVNDIFMARHIDRLLPITAMFVGAFFVKGITNYGSSVTMEYVGQRIVASIQNDLFSHLMRQDLSFFHNITSGELISRFNNDVNKLQNAVTNTFSSLIKDVLSLIFYMSVMLYQDWLLTVIAFVIVPVAVMPVLRIGKRMRRAATNVQEHAAHLTILINQVFQSMRVIKAYNMEEYEKQRIHQVIETIFKRVYKAACIRSTTHPLVESLGGAAIGAVVFYGGAQVISGHQTPGAFFSFIAALMFAYEPLKRLANLNANLQEQLAAASRVFAIMDYQPKIIEPENPFNLLNVQGSIAFDNVDFHYNSVTVPILKNINFRISAGQRVAFVGSSGGGKSTIINLILRFYDVVSGQITLDGHNIRQLSLNTLRQHIALVSQDVILFNDSILANIAYGRPGASVAEIQAAAEAAAAHKFIIKLEHGYDTMVGEHGVKLSGGQRQRISIARAILKDAAILLLDEPSSALDSESEQHVQTALDHLMVGRTTLIVAHRLSTIKDADVIFVIDHGEIVAQGTHHYLIEHSAKYAQLAQAQL